MRKPFLVLVLCVLLLFLVSSVAYAEIIIKAGIDFPTKISLEGESHDTSGGFSIAAEYLFNNSREFKYGVGIEYQSKRGWLKDDIDFYFIPIYGLVNYNITQSIYITGKIGYNFYNIDENDEGISGGSSTYFCIGAGKILKNRYQFEVKYSVNNGIYHEMGYSHSDISYSKLGISVGFVL